MATKSVLSPLAKKNVETIALLEQQLRHRQSGVERVGASVARFFGSVRFIAAHLIFFTGWVLLNMGLLPAVRPFDPYPFALLSSMVGIEFFFLTTFVLMNQNHQMRQTERWEHLNLQISMLAEQEITKNLQMLQRVCKHLGLEDLSQDQEMKDLTQTTPVADLVEEIGKVREVGEKLTEEIGVAK